MTSDSGRLPEGEDPTKIRLDTKCDSPARRGRPMSKVLHSPCDVERVVAFLTANGETHARWATFFEENPDEEAKYVAQGTWDDAKEHRRLEAGYKDAIAIITALHSEPGEDTLQDGGASAGAETGSREPGLASRPGPSGFDPAREDRYYYDAEGFAVTLGYERHGPVSPLREMIEEWRGEIQTCLDRIPAYAEETGMGPEECAGREYAWAYALAAMGDHEALAAIAMSAGTAKTEGLGSEGPPARASSEASPIPGADPPTDDEDVKLVERLNDLERQLDKLVWRDDVPDEIQSDIRMLFNEALAGGPNMNGDAGPTLTVNHARDCIWATRRIEALATRLSRRGEK